MPLRQEIKSFGKGRQAFLPLQISDEGSLQQRAPSCAVCHRERRPATVLLAGGTKKRNEASGQRTQRLFRLNGPRALRSNKGNVAHPPPQPQGAVRERQPLGARPAAAARARSCATPGGARRTRRGGLPARPTSVRRYRVASPKAPRPRMRMGM